MASTKEPVKRITLRLRGNLMARVKSAARKKRWSINTFIEEALIIAVAESAQ